MGTHKCILVIKAVPVEEWMSHMWHIQLMEHCVAEAVLVWSCPTTKENERKRRKTRKEKKEKQNARER